MTRILCAALLAAALSTAGCKGTHLGSSPSLKTEEQKTIYTLGLLLGRNLGSFNLTPEELEIVKAGLTDQALGRKPQVELETYGPKVQALARTRAGAKAETEKGKSKAFLDKAEKEPGAVKTPSGLVIRTIKPGDGASPAATDQVKVHYHGTLTDGTVFDSSVQRGQPAEFPLNGVIPCWTEGVQKMKVGEKARLVCPSSIAYGDSGRPPKIPGGATLIFEIELLEIKKNATPPAPQTSLQPPGAHPGMPPGAAPRMMPRLQPEPAAKPPAAPPAKH